MRKADIELLRVIAMLMVLTLHYLSAVCLFIAFLNIGIRKERIAKIINKVASLTFGIFLIHSHIVLRNVIWVKLGSVKYANTGMMILHLVVVVYLVFILCGIVEAIRKSISTKLSNRGMRDKR